MYTLDNVVSEICLELNLNPNRIVIRPRINNTATKMVTVYELICLIITYNSLSEVAKKLQVTDRVLVRASEVFPFYGKLGGGSLYRTHLLGLLNLKKCPQCTEIKHKDTDFHYSSLTGDNLGTYCKKCKAINRKISYDSNPELYNQHSISRHRKLDSILTSSEVNSIFILFNNKCCNCGFSNEEHKEKWKTRLHIDHVKPISKGGTNHITNLQLLCVTCNSSKGDKEIDYRNFALSSNGSDAGL